MSKWDNRLLWKSDVYRGFGLIDEPYFDLNFNIVLYLTDTGRRWDGHVVSVRDKIQGPPVPRSIHEEGGHKAQSEIENSIKGLGSNAIQKSI